MKKRKKKYKTIKKPVIMLSISLLLLFVVNNFMMSIYKFADNELNKLESRQVLIDMTDYNYDLMGKDIIAYLDSNPNPHIVDYTIGRTNLKCADEKYGGEIDLLAFTEKIIEPYMITEGIDKLADDEIIIGKYLTRAEGADEEQDGYIDGEQFIGDTITSEKKQYFIDPETGKTRLESTKQYKLKIVGVYDNVSAGEQYADGFVSQKTLNELSAYKEQIFPDKYMQDEYKSKSSAGKAISIVVDDVGNMEDVCNEVQKVLDDIAGDEVPLNASRTDGIIPDASFYMLKDMQGFINFIAAFFLVCTVISVYSYIKECMDRRKKEFGIMKAIGYRTSGISKLMLKETLLEIFIPLAVTYGIGTCIKLLVDSFIKSEFDIYIQASLEYYMAIEVSILIISIAVLIPMFGYIMSIMKIDKIEPMEVLRQEGE